MPGQRSVPVQSSYVVLVASSGVARPARPPGSATPEFALQGVEIGELGVVLQFSGHFLLLGLRTAAPHGSTPSLARSSGGRLRRDAGQRPRRESCHVVRASVPRAEVPPHAGELLSGSVQLRPVSNPAKTGQGATCMAQSGQLSVQLWAAGLHLMHTCVVHAEQDSA